ncbi:MAG: ABC transporter ATP-binding protein [Capsulimonas sp.]|uniref:ABC transporter ATP-binding protein n=1 Tax=Capsulimonas sp. TaxID=2494211 RepID=UPI0032675B85
MNDFVIETHGLTKYYGTREVVSPLDLAVPRGSIFGFLGRNGAGKSTTIRMMLGLVEPTRGSATVLGQDSRSLTPELRARVGYLAEGHHVYGWMTVKECGEWQSRFYQNWNWGVYNGVVDHFGLNPKTKAKGLSRGERAGLCLALTLAPEPELLILDDPALGLDPVARRSLLQSMLYVTRRADRTILFSSHLLSDVERVADHIAILDRSVLRANCSLETFQDRVRQVSLKFPGTPPPPPAIPGLLHSFRTENEMVLTIANMSPDTDRILKSLNPKSIDPMPLGLEDAFISYLGDRGEQSFFIPDAEDVA